MSILLLSPQRVLSATHHCLQCIYTSRGIDTIDSLLVPFPYREYSTYAKPDDAYLMIRRILAMHIYSYKLHGDSRQNYLQAVKDFRRIPFDIRAIRHYARSLPGTTYNDAIKTLTALLHNTVLLEIDIVPYLWLQNLTTTLQGLNHLACEKWEAF